MVLLRAIGELFARLDELEQGTADGRSFRMNEHNAFLDTRGYSPETQEIVYAARVTFSIKVAWESGRWEAAVRMEGGGGEVVFHASSREGAMDRAKAWASRFGPLERIS